MSLNENIREFRKAYGMSQVELAKKLGVSKQALSNWENDNIQPSIEMLVRLSKELCVSTDRLLGLDNRNYLDVGSLSGTELAHVQQIVNDIRK